MEQEQLSVHRAGPYRFLARLSLDMACSGLILSPNPTLHFFLERTIGGTLDLLPSCFDSQPTQPAQVGKKSRLQVKFRLGHSVSAR